jgi:hypothetical protein
MYTAFDSHLSKVLGTGSTAARFAMRRWNQTGTALAGRRVR